MLVGWLAGDASAGLPTGLAVTAIAVALYAATTLRVHPIARWAGVRTLRSLGLLFPLVTRALPPFPPHPVFGWPPGLTIELERAVGVRAVYTALKREADPG